MSESNHKDHDDTTATGEPDGGALPMPHGDTDDTGTPPGGAGLPMPHGTIEEPWTDASGDAAKADRSE